MERFPVFIIFICLFIFPTIKCYEFDIGHGQNYYDRHLQNWHNGIVNGGVGGYNGYAWPPYHNYGPNFRNSDEDEAVTRGVNRQKDREPLDVDFVSGTIGNPDDTQVELGNVPNMPNRPVFPNGFPFGSYAPDTSLFQNTFADFLGPNTNNFNPFLPGFPGIDNLPTPWWKGENVCTERTEKIEDPNSPDTTSDITGDSMFVSGFNLNFETCVEKQNKHVCKKVTHNQGRVKTEVVTHACCHGFARVKKDHFNAACEKIDLTTILGTAEKLGSKELIRSAISNGLDDELKKNITLFAPQDKVFTDFTEHMLESNLVVIPVQRSKRDADDTSSMSTRDIILSHIVEDWINIEDIENEQLLKTAYKNTTIRMNIFPRPPSAMNFNYPYRYTANCAPVILPNQLATNGIVHTIEKVLTPVTKNIMEIIRERRDMTVLRTILEKTKLDEMFMTNKSITIFAPTDRAFEKLSAHLRKSLKEGNGCALNIIKNHILDLTFCSCAVVSEVKTNTVNILGERLYFERSDKKVEQGNEIEDLINEKSIIINGESRVIESDLMATNGVVHIVESVLTTDSGLPITSMLEKQNLTIFKSLIEAGNLDNEFDTLSNVTFFAPSDRAFENSMWKKTLEENPNSLKNNAELRELLKYHIAEPLIKTCDFTESEMKTKTGESLRVNLYTTHPIFTNIMNRATINCARLIHFDDDSCGSVLHQVDKVLSPPKHNLLQLLESTPEYSMFLRFIKEANLTKLLENMEQDMTLFVPKDDVFREVSDWYNEILNRPEELSNIIKAHILPDVLCCAGVVQSDWPFIRSVETINNIHLKIDRDRRPKIQNAGITKCDINAKNGIIHEINDIISINHRPAQPMQRFW